MLQSLLRAHPVEIGDVLAQPAQELPFAPDQKVIQTFAPHTAQEAFAHGIRPGRTIRNLQHFDAGVFRNVIKGGSKFTVVVTENEFGRDAVGGCFAEWLGDPLLGGLSGDGEMHHTAGREFNNEKDEESAKGEISYG